MFFYLNCLIYIGIIYCTPCKEGTNFCFRCNPISKLCEKCQNNILVPDKNGGCEPIKKCRLESSYCLECQEESIQCKKCEKDISPMKMEDALLLKIVIFLIKENALNAKKILF